MPGSLVGLFVESTLGWRSADLPGGRRRPHRHGLQQRFRQRGLACQTSLPEPLLKAMAMWSSPPTRQISRSPSKSGLDEKPHKGTGHLYSSVSFLDQMTFPSLASRQNKSPMAPSP